MKLRALIADDHQMFRKSLRRLLQSEPDIAEVEEASDGLEALAVARGFLPDLVCMDMRMPNLGGVESTRQLLVVCPGVKVIGVSECFDKESVAAMLNAGALGYVTKGEAAAELLRAIRAVRRNHAYLSSRVAVAFTDGPAFRKVFSPALNARQRQMLALLAGGNSPAQIAKLLHLEHATVEAHCLNLLRKLDLRSLGNLKHYASAFDPGSD